MDLLSTLGKNLGNIEPKGISEHIYKAAFEEAIKTTPRIDVHYTDMSETIGEKFVCADCEMLLYVKVQDDSFDFPTGYGSGYATEYSYGVSTECCESAEFIGEVELFEYFLEILDERLDYADLPLDEDKAQEWFNATVEVV